ncbi:MAG TPA: prolipoprotein diacylglyceryl transferase [Patescibacteria group bacterium]|nr:prolipoprotein diacylglyceryl transferase [Patescibacteria group bacterium]
MWPVLITVGYFKLFSFSVFIVVAWCIFSFLFWKKLRSDAIDDDKIFDLTFYSTLAALIGSRLAFVYFNWPLFAATPLKIVTLWVQPGLSLYGAFLAGTLTLISLSRQQKVRLGHILDAFALSFPAALVVGLIGALLDGSVIGKVATLPWAVRFVGHAGRRHPVELYEMIALGVIMIVLSSLENRSVKNKWPYGIVGVWFFILYSLFMFPLEFFKETRVYWISLSANQWVLIAFFAEAVGAFYVRGGGREMVRPLIYRIRASVRGFMGGIYAKFSK